ncbi:MAG TPA: phosphopantetheine-binding protein, partial [Caldilineaceae bacterium]|nr:phosphopantetheine-binding protein [Caldilineaceae bacterium]
LVLRLQAAIEHQFQADLSFTTLFQNSTIEQLAVVLGQNGGEANGGPGAWPVIPATLSAGT